MSYRKAIPFAALALLLPGCEKNQRPLPNSAVTTNRTRSTNPPTLYLDHALPKLPTLKLWIGAKEMEAELALDHTQIATGMMYRKEMGENAGMLFVFGRPVQVAFYMRNTIIPLSAAYIDTEGVILEIHDLKPLDETPIEASSDKVQFVLETPQGWFKRNNIDVGALIRSEYGSLQEVFSRRREP